MECMRGGEDSVYYVGQGSLRQGGVVSHGLKVSQVGIKVCPRRRRGDNIMLTGRCKVWILGDTHVDTQNKTDQHVEKTVE